MLKKTNCSLNKALSRTSCKILIIKQQVTDRSTWCSSKLSRKAIKYEEPSPGTKVDGEQLNTMSYLARNLSSLLLHQWIRQGQLQSTSLSQNKIQLLLKEEGKLTRKSEEEQPCQFWARNKKRRFGENCEIIHERAEPVPSLWPEFDDDVRLHDHDQDWTDHGWTEAYDQGWYDRHLKTHHDPSKAAG